LLSRLSLAVLLSAVLIFTAAATTFSAHGPLLRGHVIPKSTTLTSSTGNCSCVWQWYTLGLQKGTFSLTTTVRSFAYSMGPTYGIAGTFFQNGRTLSTAQAACLSSRHRCDQSFRISYQVSKAGVYYILLRGLGAEVINFTMRVQGRIVPLHCHRFC
jgi:hypothetical protein